MTSDELRSWLERHAMTASELARRLGGIHRSVVTRWLDGTHDPPPYLERALRDLERELESEHSE